jgi:hypothetical protein
MARNLHMAVRPRATVRRQQKVALEWPWPRGERANFATCCYILAFPCHLTLVKYNFIQYNQLTESLFRNLDIHLSRQTRHEKQWEQNSICSPSICSFRDLLRCLRKGVGARRRKWLRQEREVKTEKCGSAEANREGKRNFGPDSSHKSSSARSHVSAPSLLCSRPIE